MNFVSSRNASFAVMRAIVIVRVAHATGAADETWIACGPLLVGRWRDAAARDSRWPSLPDGVGTRRE